MSEGEKIFEEMKYTELLEEIQDSLDKYKSLCGENKKNIVIEVKELTKSIGLGYLY